ncbi:MAG: sensor histidine kinase [Hyalangium sp.]|uniref:sensor histidine kinase n=1 Tax=Hyalangium sp. TaxID=2028555 RepID=UPI00389A9381
MGIPPTRSEGPGGPPARETTVEELLEMVSRLSANDPHAQCRVGTGPLAPVAQALNTLSTQLVGGRTRVSEAFGLQALVEQAPNMMLACEPDGRIRFMNFTLPGFVLGEVMNLNVYHFIAPHEHERVKPIIQHVLETGEPAGYEIHSIVKPGPEWFAVRVGAIRAGQEIVGFTMILTDISDLKQTQARLEQSNQELESFAYVASHDLQEPLRKIQTFGDRLKKTSGEKMGPEGLDYLERMMGAASRMRRLIDDLLSFARLSSQARPFSSVDLQALAREVLGDLETAIERAGATVTLGELPTLDADPTQLRQLLQNLVSNALKFRREDVAPSVSLQATVNEQTQQCELRVEDNGIGFEEKYAERIFQVFQRLHGRGSKYEGTGIGLAICRKIVERHGGSIRAHSSPGNGAAFIASLPLKQYASK